MFHWNPNNTGMALSGSKTLFVDVMKDGRFLFTMPYRHCPLFKLDLNDVYAKVYEKRPSLKGQKIEIYID